ncbi:MAG TPA: hypothetical protein VNT26_18445 [Candidatus Sulfotelmatobacter sp.]|nr:hypothetical protein [Candidatus Sulfotelmatobacter sp.]
MLFVLLACGLLGAIAFLSLRGRGPSCNGHSLVYWVSRMDSTPGTYPDMYDAAHAIREIGTNALPFLLRWIEAEPQPWRSNAVVFLESHGAYRVASWIPDDSNMTQAHRTLGALIALHEKAIPAIPELTRLMNNAAKPDTAGRAMAALAELGTNSLPASLRPSPTQTTTIAYRCSTISSGYTCPPRRQPPPFLPLFNASATRTLLVWAVKQRKCWVPSKLPQT